MTDTPLGLPGLDTVPTLEPTRTYRTGDDRRPRVLPRHVATLLRNGGQPMLVDGRATGGGADPTASSIPPPVPTAGR